MVGVVMMELVTDLLLLMAVSRLGKEKLRFSRALAAAALGSLYVALCLLPGLEALAHPAIRILSRVLLPVTAFGFRVRGILLFISVNTALQCAAQPGKLLPLFLSAASVCLLSLPKIWGRGEALLPVELSYGDKEMKLTALQDTGNTLRDPITGRSVLVVGADVAKELTGLSREQLLSPLQTMGALPGLRLIPYKTVAGRGFLLALHFPQVRIGNYRGSSLVAFAPEGIGNGNYQALTGGSI